MQQVDTQKTRTYTFAADRSILFTLYKYRKCIEAYSRQSRRWLSMLKLKLISGVNDGRYWSCCQSIYHPLNQVMICSAVLFDISIFDRRFTMIDHPRSYLSTCLLINIAHSLLESNINICQPVVAPGTVVDGIRTSAD